MLHLLASASAAVISTHV